MLGAESGRIARQQCRARIETYGKLKELASSYASPGSNAGRGLKLEIVRRNAHLLAHRPAAMPGAD